jgi:ATP-dependent Clp protease adaptor protein ClpS
MPKKKLTHKGKYQLIVYNDDLHTFDEVIELLIGYAGHNPLQAQQCAMIIHNNGKYAVLEDKYDVCYDIMHDLAESGLRMEILKK